MGGRGVCSFTGGIQARGCGWYGHGCSQRGWANKARALLPWLLLPDQKHGCYPCFLVREGEVAAEEVNMAVVPYYVLLLLVTFIIIFPHQGVARGS